jgi:hypothetical protein
MEGMEKIERGALQVMAAQRHGTWGQHTQKRYSDTKGNNHTHTQRRYEKRMRVRVRERKRGKEENKDISKTQHDTATVPYTVYMT